MPSTAVAGKLCSSENNPGSWSYRTDLGKRSTQAKESRERACHLCWASQTSTGQALHFQQLVPGQLLGSCEIHLHQRRLLCYFSQLVFLLNCWHKEACHRLRNGHRPKLFALAAAYVLYVRVCVPWSSNVLCGWMSYFFIPHCLNDILMKSLMTMFA